jgi:two-component system, OmpR family, sensor histidine kinase SenX3
MNDLKVQPGMEAFLASSVHDMKNSISMLIGGLEKTLSQVDPAVFPACADLAHMIYEAKRINSNLIQLLTLFKAGHDLYPFDPQAQAVGDFLRVTGDQNAPLLASQGIDLELCVDDEFYWEFDEDLVSGVIGNALNNAIHYTRDRIRLVAREDGGFLELRIEDNGQGYPQSMLDAGVEAMRGVDFLGGSTGLGLHFSVVAAKMHRNRGRRGEIRLENGGAWGGGCFVLRLP